MIIAFLIITSILVGVQIFLEGKRRFLVPDTNQLGDFDYQYKEETLSDSASTNKFRPSLDDVTSINQKFYTDGRFWMMFVVQKDVIWVGRGIALINSWFFTHAYGVFTVTGANSLYFNIFVLICIFQISYWFYYSKTPIIAVLFDKETQGVYIPPFVENPDMFLPLDKMVFYEKKGWFGQELVAAASITRLVPKKIKLANDFSEPSTFTLYHLPPAIFMRYNYSDCAKVLSTVFVFMGNYQALEDNPNFKQSLSSIQDISNLQK